MKTAKFAIGLTTIVSIATVGYLLQRSKNMGAEPANLSANLTSIEVAKPRIYEPDISNLQTAKQEVIYDFFEGRKTVIPLEGRPTNNPRIKVVDCRVNRFSAGTGRPDVIFTDGKAAGIFDPKYNQMVTESGGRVFSWTVGIELTIRNISGSVITNPLIEFALVNTSAELNSSCSWTKNIGDNGPVLITPGALYKVHFQTGIGQSSNQVNGQNIGNFWNFTNDKGAPFIINTEDERRQYKLLPVKALRFRFFENCSEPMQCENPVWHF